MNVREEEKRKNSCPGRGFGLAAAAIGVGVGAALYYFFNQGPENHNGEGSTTEDWQGEQPHTFECNDDNSDNDSDSYTTISEHSTTDTSIEDTNESLILNSNNITSESSDASPSESESDEDPYSIDDSDESSNNSEQYLNNISIASSSSLTNDLNRNSFIRRLIFENVGNMSDDNIDTDSETAMEWDVTTSSDGLPSNDPTRAPMLGYLHRLGDAVSPMAARQMANVDRMKTLSEQAYRERPWTLEECSICFEVMLRTQEVMKLPCSHNFHSQCIMPWLQEKQTCPNCRKVA